jgi:hypothetical protein
MIVRNVGVYLRVHTALQHRRRTSNEEIYSVVFLFYALKTARSVGSYPNTYRNNQVYNNKSYLFLYLLDLLPTGSTRAVRIQNLPVIFAGIPDVGSVQGRPSHTNAEIHAAKGGGAESTNLFFELPKTMQALDRAALMLSC